MLGTRTRGSRIVGADESTELWRHPFFKKFPLKFVMMSEAARKLKAMKMFKQKYSIKLVLSCHTLVTIMTTFK